MRPDPGAVKAHPNLLDQLTADAVASDYAAPLPISQGSSRREQIVVATLGLGLAGFVLSMGISAKWLDQPVVNEQRAALSARILDTTNQQTKINADLAELRKQATHARESALQLSVAGRDITTQLDSLGIVTGYAPTVGPGLVVTLTDGPLKDGQDPELSKVLDSDVADAVNGLWQSGAEAISVNGQRLTATSAIRSAAGAILVNYRPLLPPYVIEAVGEPDAMYAQFPKTADALSLSAVSKQFGIGFSTTTSPHLALVAATSALPTTAQIPTQGRTSPQ